MNDTITAISTSQGIGAIAIIRVSGTEAIKIVNEIFTVDLTTKESHTIHYGFIKYENKIVDEVLVSIMKSPKTFTTEDTVEINTHGGIATTKKVLEILLEKGCRQAEPGEFTKRAYLNNRIDLLEAEAVMDLINAKTEKTRTLALNQVNGKVSEMIELLRNELIQIISNIEVNIDYPEYEDIEDMNKEKIKSFVKTFENKIEKILKESDNGKLIKEGIDTVIIGKPNVGKSSILNRLIGEDKAIVTNIEGTTRDIVEGQIIIDGIILNLIDTAGIRKTKNIIEQKGVEKSLNLIEKAKLILLVLSNEEEIGKEEIELINKIKDKKHIIIVNKKDLNNKQTIKNAIYVSAKENKNIENIKEKIKELFNLEELETDDLTYLSNARSIAKLIECKNFIEDINKNIDNLSIDMIEIDLKNIWNLLGDIIGKNYNDELIDEMFKRFCLGK